MEKVLYMHTGSGNHGCEAIVRTTARLLGKDNTLLWSMTKAEDIQYGLEGEVQRIYESEEMSRFSLAYLETKIRQKVCRQSNAALDVFLKKTFRNRIAFSVGGDNYCYPWSAQQAIELDKKIQRWSKAMVLWGCSIDSDALTPEVVEDLRKFDLITARESITYELLKPINPNTKLVADPAFLLETAQVTLPGNFIHGNTIGINISPLIMRYSADENLILDNYTNLIHYIVENTDMHICLIPHVAWSYNSDLEAIRLIEDRCAGNKRISVIEDGRASELKGYISQCRFFIGARTHATIAAYSSGVPTLVVGYSTKSRGIAKDLFGTEEHYVLPVQRLKSKSDLTDQFIWLSENEQNIRKQLEVQIPNFKDKARSAAQLVDELERTV